MVAAIQQEIEFLKLIKNDIILSLIEEMKLLEENKDCEPLPYIENMRRMISGIKKTDSEINDLYQEIEKYNNLTNLELNNMLLNSDPRDICYVPMQNKKKRIMSVRKTMKKQFYFPKNK